MGSASQTASQTQPPVTPPALAEHSRFVQRIRRRYADELALLPPGLPRRDTVTALVATLRERGRTLASALRVARHLVLERLAVLDIEQGCAMEEVTLAMTELAEATLDLALAQAIADQSVRHGLPRSEGGGDIEFWVVGMGKLGARELNVSSDIDLVYVYEEDGQTDGAVPISAHEFFSQVARGLYTLIGDTTDDGFVFRVDLMLRPNGNSGPPVVSLAMLEDYLQIQGREWERFAWLKSRVVAPRASVSNGRALPLRDIINSFVYRKYLDYGVFEGLRQLHRKVRDEAQRRAAGRPERANDVKLSRGGIREIEFIVQLLQVVRGGQFPEMRTRSTLKALSRLAASGLMKPESATRLGEAYVFLRRVEHRIQFLDDQQTHLLPTGDGDLNWIARSLGLACNADACELLDRLGEMREFVALEFDALLHDGRESASPSGNGGRKSRHRKIRRLGRPAAGVRYAGGSPTVESRAGGTGRIARARRVEFGARHRAQRPLHVTHRDPRDVCGVGSSRLQTRSHPRAGLRPRAFFWRDAGRDGRALALDRSRDRPAHRPAGEDALSRR